MTVMELMHRLNLKHLFVFELPRSRFVSAFFQRDSCPTEVHGLQRSGSSALSSATTSKKDTERKRERKKQRRRERERSETHLPVFRAKHCRIAAGFWLILRSPNNMYPSNDPRSAPGEGAVCESVEPCRTQVWPATSR